MAVVLTLFSACQQEELDVNEPQIAGAREDVPDVYTENGYLAFKNMSTVDSVMNVLSGMSREQKDAWDAQMGFKSARADFEKLFDEYEQLNSQAEFLAFKEKYRQQLTFNDADPEDNSIDYPFVETYFAELLNSQGVFKIGNSIIQYRKESKVTILDGDLDKLKNLSDFSGDDAVLFDTNLKSSSSVLITDFPDWNPFPGQNDRWWESKEHGKRLLNELRIDRNVVGLGDNRYERTAHIYLKQRAQKPRTFGGWKDYKTQYYFGNMTVQYGNFSRTDQKGYISKETKVGISSVYNYSQEIYSLDWPSQLPILSPLVFSCKTSYRGFHYEEYWAKYPESK